MNLGSRTKGVRTIVLSEAVGTTKMGELNRMLAHSRIGELPLWGAPAVPDFSMLLF